MRMILAQMPDVPWTVTSKWVWGLMGFLGCVWLVFAVCIQAKRLFGRTPPIQDELERREKKLRGEIMHQKNSALKEMRSVLTPLIARVEKAENDIEEMQLDRSRKWAELQKEIHTIAQDVAFIRGQEKERAARS
jgi:hypothetical protein